MRSDGDSALKRITERFDKVSLESIAVSTEEIQKAYSEVSYQVVSSLRESAERIKNFHELQKGKDLWLQETDPGISLGVKTTPLERVGVYVPGGRAAYPSTALMCAIPAKVAGVKEICICSPPPIDPMVLVAADIAGANEVFQVGGAQAIAAMALGTESIKPVQKIVGPGNVYVTAAKQLLQDIIMIDFPAGPSEIAIIADSSSNPKFLAADIMAQAEHDPQAACVLITTERTMIERVTSELKEMVSKSTRKELIEKALDHSGYLLVMDLDQAVNVSNEIAPEHLSIQVRDPMALLEKVQNAGSIFIGPYAAVACGDYASGTNHVLPTAGFAKQYSGLDLRHFLKTSSVQVITKEGLKKIAPIVETLAKAEGLDQHAESVRVRLENGITR